ncbi:MAG: cbb3-type cytochrome c oxidase N-terminal domain-containing protein [Bacteroidota bacterium]
MKKDKNNKLRKALVLAVICALPQICFSQQTGLQGGQTYFSNALFNTLLLIIIVLAIMIIGVGNALKNVVASDAFREKIKNENKADKKTSPKITSLLILFLLSGLSLYSQEKTVRILNDTTIGGLDQSAFYLLIVTIAGELLVLGILFSIFKTLLGINKTEAKPQAVAKPKTKTILDQINDTVDIEQEESIMLDHDYDGIKELDNNLPPWWKYGFYLTIIIAFIYMINYHITKTAPLQMEEYTNSIKKAEAEIAQYMKNSADNVDENTVKLLTDASDLAAGKDLFISTCSACHGKLGEGTVGPNLTDDYWLHNGSVRDIFKTIKYGWPDKGMKSWKEDFSPMQIAQLTGFIRSLNGTNPPKAKEQQGDLYLEQSSASDSTVVKTDSTKTLVSDLPLNNN